MKKIIKSILVLLIGIIIGYYISFSYSIKNIFKNNYKAFQVGVYTTLDAARTYSSKYNNSIIVKDNELYRIYVSILKDIDNIENMKDYLKNNNINYYLKDIEINDRDLKKALNEYENLMSNQNETLFLEINKMIIERYKESV